MKILHTADWHIGKVINGHSLIDDQNYVLNQLYKAIEEHNPDLIVISGDLYDLHYPNKKAMLLLEEALSKINLDLDTPIIAISGNHDGKERLNYGEKWFEKSGLKIVTDFINFYKPIIYENVHIYVLPYFTPLEIKNIFNVKDIKNHQEATEYLVNRIYEKMDKTKKNVLIGHMFVEGGEVTNSERPLSIGTIETVKESTFNQFDVVMLGHLHHPFAIKSNNIFYSGSLMQYSFSEKNQSKGYRLFEINEEETKQRFIPLIPKHAFHEVEATYDDLVHERIVLPNKHDYYHFKLKNMDHVTDPIMKIRAIYPNTLQISRLEETIDFDEISVDVHSLSDIEIVEEFYKHVTGEDINKNKRNKIINILEQELNRGGNE